VVSRTVGLVTSWKARVSDTQRVPFISITMIDGKTVVPENSAETNRERAASSQGSARAIRVRQGESVEVASYDRLPESAGLWILTRSQGSSVWLAQGPMLPRGGQTPEASNERRTQPIRVNGQPIPPQTQSSPSPVTYVLPELRFESSRKEDDNSKDYEVMAVVSTVVYPNTWIPTTFLASKSIETISEIVRVSVDGPVATPEAKLSIAGISGRGIDLDSVVPVGATGSVAVDTAEELPRGMRVYVCEHLVSSFTWSCNPTIRNGNRFTAADVTFTNPHALAGTRYQLVAIATMGLLTVDKFNYSDLLNHAAAASETVTVEYAQSTLPVLWDEFRSLVRGEDFPPVDTTPFQQPGSPKSPTSQGWGRMAMRMLPLLLLIVGFIGFVLCLYLLERKFKTISKLSGDAANALDDARKRVQDWHKPAPEVNLTKLFLGATILISVLYAIIHFYFRLYSHVVADVTHLQPQESAGLAAWLLLLTALAGMFIHLSRNSYLEASTKGERGRQVIYLMVGALVGLIAIFLWLVQGFMYYTSLHHSSPGETLLPYAGGLMFTLIAVVETTAFFYVLELTYGSLSWLIIFACCLAIGLISLPFHLLYRLFEPISAATEVVAKTDTANVVELSPASLNFGNQMVGTTSGAQGVTLTNTSSKTLQITSTNLTGDNLEDFAQTNTNGKKILPGATCAIRVTFTPTAQGNRAANVSFTDARGVSSQTVALTGIGT